ncbi:MAG: mechanosensitive ion channel protein MscS [Ignavibacteriae bacterium HGW-Ignavibacteriae-3]|nr:MAG: mechanosensitive ion channel protein MscS [Ignavibacteriae bacterium HGW-Ignavibacteriae-3]
MNKFFEEHFGLSAATQTNLIVTIIIILVIILFYRLTLKLIIDRLENTRLKYQWKKFVLYFFVALSLFIVTRIWFGIFEGFATYLGLLSAGIAIALKDPLVNLVGWFFILIRKPFQIGDRIQIGENIGDVIDIRIFQFSIMEVGNWVEAEQSTGRIVHIPNGFIFIQPQANYTTGFEYIWHEIPILITFESNWVKAKDLLNQVLDRNTLHLTENAEKQIREAAKKYMIYYKKLTPRVYTSVKDSGVQLTVRFMCDPRKRRDTEEAIFEDILNEFSKCSDIDFAYPTQRFYNNQNEGKPGKT